MSLVQSMYSFRALLTYAKQLRKVRTPAFCETESVLLTFIECLGTFRARAGKKILAVDLASNKARRKRDFFSLLA